MGRFYDERIPIYVNYGASFKQTFAIQKQDSQNGDDFRSQFHSRVRLDYNFTYDEDVDVITSEIIDFYHSVNGEFGVFRVRDWADYSTNAFTGTPTINDMECLPYDYFAYQQDGFTDTWKLVRWYTDGDVDLKTTARRDILLPLVGTVKLKFVDDAFNVRVLVEGLDFSVDYTTGAITFLETFYSGRGYTIEELIQGSVYGGCEFDIPCRFDGSPSVAFNYYNGLVATGVKIREVFNMPEIL